MNARVAPEQAEELLYQSRKHGHVTILGGDADELVVAYGNVIEARLSSGGAVTGERYGHLADEEGDLAFTIEVHVQSEALREEYEQMESPKPSFEDYRAEQSSLAADSVRAWWTDERVSVTIR